MAKRPVVVHPPQQEDELTVTVFRFRGSPESMRKGFEAFGAALGSALGTSTSPARQVNGTSRKAQAQLVEGTQTSEDVELENEDEQPDTETDDPAVTSSPKPKKAAKSLYTFMTDLNLSPEGKTAWKVFAAAKSPDGFNERLLVASAWLQTEGGRDYYAGGELFTCFRSMEWTTHTDMTNTMRKLKSTKSYYDNPEHGKWRLTQVGLDAASAIGPQA